MSKGLFITGTGTDVGKTYISALLIKKLRQSNINCGYYKAAISGADSITNSDAGYVNNIAKIEQDEKSLVSYLYKTPVSPHLASNIEGNPVELDVIKSDYDKLCDHYDYIVTEGSGGIVCPIRYDYKKVMLTDIVKLLDLSVVIVADAGLGTINTTALTAYYLKSNGFNIRGIILNNFEDNCMHRDNHKMIESLTGIDVIAVVARGDSELGITAQRLTSLFE